MNYIFISFIGCFIKLLESMIYELMIEMSRNMIEM